MKECTKCKGTKELKFFGKDSSHATGLRVRCKACIKVYAKKHREDNKEYYKKYYSKYLTDNAEYVADRQRKYNAKNKESQAKNKAEYAVVYKDRINKQRRVRRPAYVAKRKVEDPVFKLRYSLSSMLCNIIKAKGYSKTSKSADLLGGKFDIVWLHLKKTWFDHYGYDLEDTDKYDIHHIIYCRTANTKEELIKLQHHTNLRLLTPEDHRELHRVNK